MQKYKIIYTAYSKLRKEIIDSGYPKAVFSEVVEAKSKKEAEMLFLDRNSNVIEILETRKMR